MTTIVKMPDMDSIASIPTENLPLLRRRIEDTIRKNPMLLKRIAAMLYASDCIKISDLVARNH